MMRVVMVIMLATLKTMESGGHDVDAVPFQAVPKPIPKKPKSPRTSLESQPWWGHPDGTTDWIFVEFDKDCVSMD